MNKNRRNRQRSKAGEEKSLFWFRAISVTSVLMILAGNVVYILYSHRYGLLSKLAFIFHVCMFFLAICLFIISYDLRYPLAATRGWRKFAGKTLVFGFVILYLFTQSFCKDSYDAYQIRKHGQKVVGV
ncbi:MAG: hypothetical protein O9353_01905, partial [Bacteroidia bacterium]|nr:hypothetical protein [Bacteroidia bacterium]